jgi:hypothetical protein
MSIRSRPLLPNSPMAGASGRHAGQSLGRNCYIAASAVQSRNPLPELATLSGPANKSFPTQPPSGVPQAAAAILR